MSVNKAILIGRLGADPEVRYTQGGQAVANFNIATDRTWTDKSGQKQEKTEWHRIVAWGRTGELCGEYLRKGREVYVEGRIETREWQDRDGNRRWSTEINAQNVTFLGGRGDGGGGGNYGGGGGGGNYGGSGGGGGGGGGGGNYGGGGGGDYGGGQQQAGGPPPSGPPQGGQGGQSAPAGPPGGNFDDDDIPF